MQDILEPLVMHLVKHVPPLPTPPLSNAPLVPIKSQPPVTQVTGWSRMRVVRALLLHMPSKATAQSVKPVPPLTMPPLSNAPLVRMKKLLPVMPGILEILVMPLAKAVVLVPLQILEQVPGQPRVLLVPLVRIHYLPTLRRVRPVPPLPMPPLSSAPLV
jgi:hypothetical protein